MAREVKVLDKEFDIITLNMGPQHPSTHGVLRLVLELESEIVRKATPIIGYLHRGIEKLAEHRSYHQIIPLTDRLDYAGCFANNLGYVLAVEKLLGIEDEIPPRAAYLRVIMNELTRISSHLLWLGTHAMDIGAVSVFLYCFREREDTYDLFEEISGQRMTVSFARIGGVALPPPDGWTDKVWKFCDYFKDRIPEYEALLTNNPIWKMRTVGVGVLSAEEAINLGVTGPVLRGSGVEYDVRKAYPYCRYDEFDFIVPTGKNGDTYDRYLVRLEEMRQSIRIIEQALEKYEKEGSGPVLASLPKIVSDREKITESMESLIYHFMLMLEGFRPPEGELYFAVEAPKGELGFTIISDGGPKPYRLKIRVPSFGNLQALPKLVEGRFLADVVALIGTIDICLADVDK